MRKFQIYCKDKKTGYQMILSECSYNHACAWLEKELKKKKLEVVRCKVNDANLTEIWTAGQKGNTVYTGRTFYYDEERGYLLGE